MRHSLLTILLLLCGCASVHELPGDVPDEVPAPLDPITSVGVDPPLAIASELEVCLAGGGQLVEVASVDNDDVAEHGELFTLAVDRDGRIAVAAADGTIKLWTMEGFVGTLSPGAFLYGAEIGATPASDLLFHDGRVIAGDVRGLVSAWSADGTFEVLGGVEPDVRVVAVAVDRAGARLAHADEREGGRVMVRTLGGVGVDGPLSTQLALVHDLAFLGDGTLLMAGGADVPMIEAREPSDPTRVRASWRGELAGELLEIAAAGGRVAGAGPTTIALLDEDLAPRWVLPASEHGPVSVALSRGGRFVVTVGADGSLRALDADDGAELAIADVADPRTVRVDPSGSAIVVGSRDGAVRAFECALP